MASQDMVGLNVGGTYYLTSKTTLTLHRESMLGTLVDGSIPTHQDEGGRYCIDRDGALFQHVLNFLRSGTLALPEDFNQHKQLALEADFYQIQPLVVALRELEVERNELETERKELETKRNELEAKRNELEIKRNELEIKRNELGNKKKRPSPSPGGETIEVIECRGMTTGNRKMSDEWCDSYRFTKIIGQRDVLGDLRSDMRVKVRGWLQAGDGNAELYHYGEGQSPTFRITLAGFLHSSGWQLQGHDQSSCCTSKDEVISFYRERWFLPANV